MRGCTDKEVALRGQTDEKVALRGSSTDKGELVHTELAALSWPVEGALEPTPPPALSCLSSLGCAEHSWPH